MTESVAIIGAGGGIGRACVAAFAAEGWKVAAADLDQAAAAAALGPADGFAAALDVTDPNGVAAFADRCGNTAAVVYAVGITDTMPIVTTDFGRWRRLMAVNLDGAAHAAAAFASGMVARRTGGSMVFLSSAAGVRGEAGASAYCASKFGLIGLVESVAAELAPHGIRANAVAPGNVDTPMLAEVARGVAATEGRSVEEVWANFSRTGAARRLVEPAEVAAVCLALCTPGFAAVTGTTVRVDAGYLLMG